MKPIEDEILALSRSIVDIELRRDAAALEALICDDYVGVDPSGAIIDKAISVGRYRDPEFELTEHGIADVQISVLGDVALEIGVMRLAGRLGVFRFGGRYRYTHAWLRTGVGWKVRASQLTPILKSAA